MSKSANPLGNRFSFGEWLRHYRKGAGMSLEELSELSGTDTGVLSKIERSKRLPTRDLISKLARIFPVREDQLVKAWLSDKIAFLLQSEEESADILKEAGEKLLYLTRSQEPLLREWAERLQYFLDREGFVQRLWVFGSFARGDFRRESDVDIMVRYFPGTSVSEERQKELQQRIGQLIGKTVDLVSEDRLPVKELETIFQDRRLIYG